VPVDAISNRTIHAFTFSNSGYFFPRRYKVTHSSVTEIGDRLRDEEVASLAGAFRFIGGEKPWVDLYTSYAGIFAEETKRIIAESGAEPSFMGHAARTQDLFENPNLVLLAAMANPTWQGRQRALEQALVTSHELWIAAQIVDAIGGKTIYPTYDEKPYWWIEWASDRPTCVVECPSGIFTFWYQFSFIPHISTVAHGIDGKPLGRLHVRPDITVLRGRYESRQQLEEAKLRGVVVDAKIELKDKDLRQLEVYRRITKDFLEKRDLILVSFQGVPTYLKRQLEAVEWMVFDDIRPHSKETVRFKETVRSSLCKT
jgi:hypothetical protein